MKQYMVKHQIVNTYGSEFHSRLCEGEEFFDSHFHKNYEIILCIEGKCQLSVAGNNYELKKGQAAFIMPFQIHSFHTEINSSVRYTTFHEALILTLSRVLDGSIPESPIYTPTAETLGYFCSQSLKLFGKDSGMLRRISPPSKRLKAKGILYSLESEFLEQSTFHKTHDTEAVVSKTLEYISKNFKNNISLHTIATDMGYNYQYLSRTFNYTLGMRFKRLLNLYRLENALYNVLDTKKPITEIAFESGFQSIRSMNKAFADAFGCSPTELRRRDERLNDTN